MRTGLGLTAVTLAAIWLLAAAASTGLNICYQDTGRVELGFGCPCEKCEQTATADVSIESGNCCNHLDDSVTLAASCCSCEKLPVLVGLAGANRTLPDCQSVIQARAPVCRINELEPVHLNSLAWTRANPPPDLQDSVVLRL